MVQAIVGGARHRSKRMGEAVAHTACACGARSRSGSTRTISKAREGVTF